MSKIIRGFKTFIPDDPDATHRRPCECNNCGEVWIEERSGSLALNGFDYFDYCSECKDSYKPHNILEGLVVDE